MPSRTAIAYATPRCPGTATNVTQRTTRSGLAKGTTTRTISQHIPCDLPCAWDHDRSGWICAQHGKVLTGEQAASGWADTLELDAVEQEAA